MPFSERRRYARLPFHAEALLILNDVPHHGSLVDISLSGALFVAETTPRCSSGQACHLALRHAMARVRLLIACTIAHVEGVEIGMLFQRMNDQTIRGLKQIIDPRVGVPALLRGGLTDVGS